MDALVVSLERFLGTAAHAAAGIGGYMLLGFGAWIIVGVPGAGLVVGPIVMLGGFLLGAYEMHAAGETVENWTAAKRMAEHLCRCP